MLCPPDESRLQLFQHGLGKTIPSGRLPDVMDGIGDLTGHIHKAVQ